MSYLVIARKYRPQNFDDVIGQQPIATTLKNAITSNRVAHAYLFSGPRGVGKTTMARILSKALNCERGPTPYPCNECEICKSIAAGNDIDVREIDGASNRGIDEIRDIRNNVRLAPARARYKIYYIDEVHMLTKDAFNALLKTLEEPPPHVKFIFATTEPHRLLETVQSRCQRFDFQRISTKDIVECLSEICKAEDVKVEDGVLEAIARSARGGMRDAESVLDQLISFCSEQITLADVDAVIGSAPTESIFSLFNSIFSKDISGALKIADDLLRRGKDVGDLLAQFIEHVRDLMVVISCGADTALIERSSEDLKQLTEQSTKTSIDSLLYMTQILSDARRKARDNIQNRVVLEIAIVKLARMQDLAQLKNILAKIEELEQKLMASGDTRPSSQAEAAPTPATGQFRRTQRTHQAPSHSVPATTEPSPPSTTTAVKGGHSFEQITASWQTILENIKQKAVQIHAFLVEGKLESMDENHQITVRLPWAFHRDQLNDPEKRKFIETCIEEVTGQKYSLRFTAPTGGSQMQNSHSSNLGYRSSAERQGVPSSVKENPTSESTTFESQTNGTHHLPPEGIPIHENRERARSDSKMSFADKLNSTEPSSPGREKISMAELLTNPIVRTAVELFEGRIISVEDKKDA